MKKVVTSIALLLAFMTACGQPENQQSTVQSGDLTTDTTENRVVRNMGGTIN